MNHCRRIQNSLEFIETNLAQDFTLNDVSSAAFSSLSYMHRVFYQMTGFTMKDYVRQRRLAVAVELLQATKKSVLDIALIAGYQSAESFARAFKNNFGISPTACRRELSDVIICQPYDLVGQYEFVTADELDFTLQLEAVSLSAFSVTGFMLNTTLKNNQQVVDICAFADKMLQSEELNKYLDLEKTSVYGVYTDMTDQDEFNYTIGGLSSACMNFDNNMVTHNIKSSTYARFKLNRNDRIKQAWHYIYGSWFPQIDALRSHGYDFEIYEEHTTSIYIPMTNVPI